MNLRSRKKPAMVATDEMTGTPVLIEKDSRRVDDVVEDLTARSLAEARASTEGREGIQAFLEKRKPVWTR